MPLYLNDLDVVAEVDGVESALIVACYMCPAVHLAAREGRPFLRLFNDFVKSAPFEEHMKGIQEALRAIDVNTSLYRSLFICMWPVSRRRKLAKYAEKYDAVVVLACDSATETVREAVKSTGCKVIRGMEVAGITNVKMRFGLPCDISFQDCKMVPIAETRSDAAMPD